MEVSLDKFGRLVIPKPIREALGLQPGEPLTLRLEGERMVIIPSRSGADLETVDGVLVATGEALGDLPGVVEAIRDGRVDLVTKGG